ncbi:YolD-like family protein [Staphylococcus pseudintermedius]|nr:YolD-like family protein [Staphylococcus pseudintermedius]
MIDKNLPEEYQHITDYRKIPRHLLNPKIPKWRGIVKWQPFKTIPEQYEMIKQYEKNQNKIDKPLLSEEQIQDVNQKLQYVVYNNIYITVEYWRNGYMCTIKGYIKTIDELNQEIQLTNERSTDSIWLPFDCLYDIKI